MEFTVKVENRLTALTKKSKYQNHERKTQTSLNKRMRQVNDAPSVNFISLLRPMSIISPEAW